MESRDEEQDRPAPAQLDAILDLLLYAPVGLAATAAEELPKLAAKGRARMEDQMTTARTVGQFVVAEGRRQLEQRIAGMSSSYLSPEPDDECEGYSEDSVSADSYPPVSYSAAFSGAGVPGSAELAIPGYDSLSASQVVQRLEGLSSDELAAVGAYEHAHRGRQTILNRVSQLQAR